MRDRIGAPAFSTALRRWARTLVVLSCSLIALSCLSPAVPVSRGHGLPRSQRPKISIPALEKRIHALINEERKAHGLSPLAWDDSLARIARGHSKDMAGRGYFSHDTPDGKDFSFRYRQQDYTCAIRIGNTIHTGAENLALISQYRSIITIDGVSTYDWYTAEQVAAATVQGWMDSPGHRKNILTPHWLNQGIGVFITTDDQVYITQNFC